MKIGRRCLNTFRATMLAGALVLLAQDSAAAPIFFNDATAFTAAVGGGLSVESFETDAGPAATLSFPGFTLTESGGFNNATSGDGIAFLTVIGLSNAIVDGSGAAGYDDNGTSIGTFQFTNPISAFGIFATVSDPATVTMSVTGDGSISAALSANTPLFFGVFDSAGTFQTVVFAASGEPSVEFDALSFGSPQAVPEPATLLLLGLGLASAGVRRWRQRKVS